MSKKSPHNESIKDYKKIISVQEKIIKQEKAVSTKLEKLFMSELDKSHKYHQWAYWYRAWSEYLEHTIQRYMKSKDPSHFDNYSKVLKNPRIMDKSFPPLEENIFLGGDK